MTATLTQVRAALQTVLRTIETFDDGQVYATRTPSLVPPAAIIEPAEGQFYDYFTSSGSHDLGLTVLVLVSRADDRNGWKALDPYLDPSGSQSILAAVAASHTLGGIVDDAQVTGAGDYGDYEFAGTPYFGCKFFVTVMLS